jgi:hypothetical protein
MANQAEILAGIVCLRCGRENIKPAFGRRDGGATHGAVQLVASSSAHLQR